MNRRIGTFVLAAGVVGGIACAVVPQHAWTIARVLAAAVVVLVGGAILVAAGSVTGVDPERGRLDRPAPSTVAPLEPHGLRDARRMLDRPHAPGAVPREVWERLRDAARARLQTVGLDLDTPTDRRAARGMMSAETWKLLASPPPTGSVQNPRRVAALVHRTLDDLESVPRNRSTT